MQYYPKYFVNTNPNVKANTLYLSFGFVHKIQINPKLHHIRFFFNFAPPKRHRSVEIAKPKLLEAHK